MLSNEIVTFAKGDTTYFTAFQDYFYQKSDVENGRKIGSYDTTVSMSEKKDKIANAFFSEVEKRSGVSRANMAADEWAANPMVRWASFAVVDATINSVLPATINPSIGLYTDMRFSSYGDIVKFKIKPRTLFTVSKGSHGERVSFRQKKYDSDLIVAPVEHMVTVYTDMYQVLAGREDIAESVRLAVIAIETAMTTDATNALTTGMAQGTYPAALSVSGAFSVQTLIGVAQTVEAYNYGAKPIIIGTAAALAKAIPDSSLGFRGNYNADGGSIRIMKDFYGYTLMEIPQVATGKNFGLALPNDTLFIISPAVDKLVKGVLSNTLSNSNQFYDNADLTQNFTLRKDWEFVFASAAYGGLYKITG